ncbi:hypothetical protein ILYODFUR_030366 [Ilyodon furcidens]|uniref:Uncharacterized protein n=1 Tax=Ilyodon furcidens TaxID=33524 RepID=A0ABV0UKB5_9TELE
MQGMLCALRQRLGSRAISWVRLRADLKQQHYCFFPATLHPLDNKMENLHLQGVTGRCSRTAFPHQEQSPEELQKLLKPWRRCWIVYSAEWLLSTRPCSGETLCGSGLYPAGY